METAEGGWFKVFGVVTNRDIDPEELVWWSRQRCGKGEEVHSALKEDLAGGRLPSGQFGSNAAWWAITALSFNLNSAMKRLALGGAWVSKRMKAVRFGVISLPGRVAADTDYQPELGPPLILAAVPGAAAHPRLGPRAAVNLTGPDRAKGHQKAARQAAAGALRPVTAKTARHNGSWPPKQPSGRYSRRPDLPLTPHSSRISLPVASTLG